MTTALHPLMLSKDVWLLSTFLLQFSLHHSRGDEGFTDNPQSPRQDVISRPQNAIIITTTTNINKVQQMSTTFDRRRIQAPEGSHAPIYASPQKLPAGERENDAPPSCKPECCDL